MIGCWDLETGVIVLIIQGSNSESPGCVTYTSGASVKQIIVCNLSNPLIRDHLSTDG